MEFLNVRRKIFLPVIKTAALMILAAALFWLPGIPGSAAAVEVTATEVNIRSGPSADSEAVALAGPGDTFELAGAETGADG